MLLVAAPAESSQAERAAVRALATQVALALDSAVTSARRCTGGAARRASARSCATPRDLITVLQPDTSVSYQSPSIERVLGYVADDLVGERFDRLAVAGDRERLARCVAMTAAGERIQPLECALTGRDGDVRQFEILFTDLTDDEHVGGILLNARDVSERKAFEAELAHQAFHDPVTGLANRAMFAEQVRQAIARSRRDGRAPAVIFLDLDDFKTVNDSLGHAAGDEVLVEFARRLDDSVRGADVAARFGGDEFAVLLEDVDESQAAADAAQRILELLARPMQAGLREVTLSGSIGISVFGPGDGRSADELIRDADAAMYIAKRRGQERIPALRAGDARGRRRTPGAAQRPPAGARDRPARAALPAAHPPLRRFRLRGRGAAALAPSREGHDPAARLHPDRRGDRADHPDRALGAARGLPPRTAAGAPGRRGAAHEREPLARSRSSTPTSSPTSATRSRRPASRPRGSRSRSPSRC